MKKVLAALCLCYVLPGEHVTMGSLTTMIGFAGLLLSFHPGLFTIGELAVAGIGATLVSALLFLPALLQQIQGKLIGNEGRQVSVDGDI